MHDKTAAREGGVTNLAAAMTQIGMPKQHVALLRQEARWLYAPLLSFLIYPEQMMIVNGVPIFLRRPMFAVVGIEEITESMTAGVVCQFSASGNYVL
jgi:hypothetical protein